MTDGRKRRQRRNPQRRRSYSDERNRRQRHGKPVNGTTVTAQRRRAQSGRTARHGAQRRDRRNAPAHIEAGRQAHRRAQPPTADRHTEHRHSYSDRHRTIAHSSEKSEALLHSMTRHSAIDTPPPNAIQENDKPPRTRQMADITIMHCHSNKRTATRHTNNTSAIIPSSNAAHSAAIMWKMDS